MKRLIKDSIRRAEVLKNVKIFLIKLLSFGILQGEKAIEKKTGIDLPEIPKIKNEE